ncbi:helix-turn-helix transcriptional regulator [Luteimonas dalianensis]|uniref:helix-turn-helix transcriptional regulator n=1 Tax=Luteimonas dalianensis TaxID=1148196 RepID=UPI003BF240AC
MDHAQAAPVSLLRLPEVQTRVGLRRTAIYERITRGEFPRPAKLGGKVSVWDSREIDRWVLEQLRRSKAA